jgi:hypothetical protein
MRRVLASLWLDPRYRAAVLEIAHPFGLTGGADATPDRAAEQRQRRLERQQPTLGDLNRLDDHRAQDCVVEDTAVEKKAHTTWTAGLGAQEVHAHQPSGGDVEAALLPGLAATSLPRGFADLHNTARDRPTALVRRLQDEQSALPATDQGSGGSRDGRDYGRRFGSLTGVTVAHEIHARRRCGGERPDGRLGAILAAAITAHFGRRGKKRAIVAVGNSILTIIWHLLSDPDTRYHDLGPSYHDTRINQHDVNTI